MYFFNPIVISKKIQQNNSLLKAKSFAASLFVHTALLSTAFFFSLYPANNIPKDKPVLISLAEYTPSEVISEYQKPLSHTNTTMMQSKISHRSTAQERLLLTPAVSPEVSAPQFSPVPPRVVPSDILPSSQEPLHSALNPIVNDSPHDTSASSQTNEFPKPNVSTEDINGAPLGRIRAMIEKSLIYPSIARKLRVEGTVVVSFILKSDGLVEKAEILTSSGSNVLDTKAIQTVMGLSGNYPSISKTAYLKIPIVFSLTKS